MMSKIDIVIPIYYDSLPCASWNISRLLQEYEPKNLILIGPADIFDKISITDSRVKCMDEDSVVSGLTKETLSNELKRITGTAKRAGWYYQQFLKLGYALICQDEYYLIYDMDTATNNVDFFDNSGKPIFYTSGENHIEYMQTLETLLPGRIPKYDNGRSFIVNYMLFKTSFVKELIDMISESTVQGNTWWQKVMNAVDLEYINEAGFSEFETYGNFVMKYHPGFYSFGEVRQYRTVDMFISMNPSEEQLKWAFKSFDSLTFEDWSKHNAIALSNLSMKIGVPLHFLTAIHDFFAGIVVQYNYHINKWRKKR